MVLCGVLHGVNYIVNFTDQPHMNDYTYGVQLLQRDKKDGKQGWWCVFVSNSI